MKQLALLTAFVTAGWLIAVAAYTIYEVTMIQKGYDRAFTSLKYQQGLVSALNYALPSAIVCLFFIIRTNKTDPISTEIFLLCMVTCVLGFYLSFRAKDMAFPDPHGPYFAESVWWIPDPPEAYEVDD